ncbi:MAG: hypothetical protein QFX35_06050 [Candidatus Verstraetearchaeota archaeon]|nr:hypothetical protein [Candidatus Verstraetearchaeota archaeon]
MATLGIPDRFIVAFQESFPGSIVPGKYTDYGLKDLKSIYDRVGLRTLG